MARRKGSGFSVLVGLFLILAVIVMCQRNDTADKTASTPSQPAATPTATPPTAAPAQEATPLRELWSRTTLPYVYSVSVTDQGFAAVTEADFSGATTTSRLRIYDATGQIMKTWAPPSGLVNARWSTCAMHGEYVLATLSGGRFALFGDYGRNQLWMQRIEGAHSGATAMSVEARLVVTADQPLEKNSTVYGFDMAGNMKWSTPVQSTVWCTAIPGTDTSLSEERSTARGHSKDRPRGTTPSTCCPAMDGFCGPALLTRRLSASPLHRMGVTLRRFLMTGAAFFWTEAAINCGG